MRTTEINVEAVIAGAETIPNNAPVFMLNLLRYKEQADYGEPTNFAPCSGREAYFQRYIPAFNKIAAAVGVAGIKVFYAGSVASCLVAPSDEKWDDVAIVEYPDFAAFRRISESPIYAAEADQHRRAALEDWRLIATTKMNLP